MVNVTEIEVEARLAAKEAEAEPALVRRKPLASLRVSSDRSPRAHHTARPAVDNGTTASPRSTSSPAYRAVAAPTQLLLT